MHPRKCSSRQLQFVVSALSVVVLLFIASMWSSTAGAQVLYGSVTGNVTDQSGAAIPNAKLTAIEISKGISQDTVADGSGVYRFAELLPGTWRINASAPGFARLETDNVVVDANNVVRVDMKLNVAAANVNVTVTTAPPELQTDTADVHVDLSQAEVQALPSIGSEGPNVQGLLKIIPGASLPAENNSVAANPARGMTSNVNGQSSQGNSTRIDGVLDLDPWLPNDTAYVPPTDSVETVDIATNSMDAQQGMANGAEVNIQMKTGTNQFHGDLRELHTDDGMKNKNFFNPAGYKKPLNVSNQFGGAVGGPIIKNKLFFFGDIEATRQDQAPSGGNPQTVPAGSLSYATAENNGYFDFAPWEITKGLVDSSGNPVHIYDPATGDAYGNGRSVISCGGVQDRICLSRVDPAALQMAALLGKLVSNTGLGTVVPGAITNNYIDMQKGTLEREDYDGKINWVPNENTQVFGHYSTLQLTQFDPPTLGPAGGGATNGNQTGNTNAGIYNIGLGATHTFSPHVLLDANVGFTRQHITAKDVDIAQAGDYGLDTLNIPGTNDAGLPGGSNQLYWGLPSFSYTSFTTLGNSSASNPFTFRDNQYSGNIGLSWEKKHHQLRFGFEDNHTQLNHFQPQGTFQTARGIFEFNGLMTEQVTCGSPESTTNCSDPDAPKSTQFNSYADFLLGLSYQDGKEILTLNPISLRWTQVALYARDQWQVTPTLSVDYGLRYEAYPFVYGDKGLGVRLLNPATMNVTIGGHNGIPRNDGVSTGLGEFLPRLGIAWRPIQKTVVRAGFGLSADSNDWRFMRNDYPAAIGTDWTSTGTGGAVNYYNSFAPASILTAANYNTSTGPFTKTPVGVVLATPPNVSSGLLPLPNGISNTDTVPQNFRRGYIYSYNLTVERQFAGFVLNAGYVGAREVRPLTFIDTNYAPVGGGGNPSRVTNVRLGGNWPAEMELVPSFNNLYNSLQTKLTRNFGQAATIGVVYTWSRAIDYTENEENYALEWPDPNYLRRNRAAAAFDRSNNFESYWVYALPFGHGQRWAQTGVVSQIVGGWKLSGILSAMSGMPFQITNGNGNLNSPSETEVPNLVSPVQVFPGRPTGYFSTSSFSPPVANQLGNVGRNTLRGPGYFDLDSTLMRDIRINERFTFEIQGIAIGLTNTPHFNNPTADENNSAFGTITSTLATANASLGGSGGERLFYVGGKFIF